MTLKRVRVRWLLLSISAPIAAIVIMALVGCETFRTEITIPAEPAKVWAVLTDAPGYAEWNPVIVGVEGEFREGAELKIRVREPDGREISMTSTVERLEDQRTLNQFGGVPGILTFDHTYRLEPVEGGTRVTQYEEDRGLWVLFWDSSWIEPAYRNVNEALRDRVIALEQAATQ